MRFGVPLPTFRQAASREGIVRVARLAEQLGYDGVWVSDHIVIPRTELDTFAHGFGDPTHIGSLIYEPLTVLAFVAACTNRIRLGTTVIILPYRNPLVTAKVLSTIDVLSGGRVTAGVGVGWMEAEFSALGVPYQGRGALSDEYIKAMKVLWSEDRPAFHGRHVQFENIGFDPKPVQKPHIPVWIGGNSRSAIRRAARLGDAWHPTRLNVQSTHAPAASLAVVPDRHYRDQRSVTIA